MNNFHSASKIVSLPEAIEQIKKWHSTGQKIVFTNGCFDLVHLGHVDYLEKARNLGDFLVVGVNTDASVSCIKGPSRPVANELSRTRVLASMGFVDLVVLFGEPTPETLIEAIQPDILTKGDDYSVENIVGAKFVIDRGGEVVTLPLVKGHSTSQLVNRILTQS